METRTFRARNMTDALRQTRLALGPEAMIISARTLDGATGAVEITAVGSESGAAPLATPRGPAIKAPLKSKKKSRAKSRPTDDIQQDFPVLDEEAWQRSIQPLREEISSLRRMVTEMRRVTDEAILPGFNDLRTLILESSREQEASRTLGPLYTELMDRGVMPDLARDLVRSVELELGLKDANQDNWLSLSRGILRDQLSKEIVVSGPIAPDRDARIFSFIGPSGVGKTTTMVKLASRMALAEGLNVVIITTDNYRIGSIEQARRYSELIGIPFVVADRRESMLAALNSYSNADVLLVDTPGRAFENEEVRHSLLSILSSMGERVESHLLIAATYSPSQQAAIAARFACFNPSRLVLTKLDETLQPGGLLNIIRMTQLPISYLTSGQRVPEDIEVAKTSRIVETILGAQN